MTNISPEIVARMEALVRKLASSRYGIIAADEARDIVALLPEPVDQDLLDAREIARQTYNGGCLESHWLTRLDRGEEDDSAEVRGALAGIKRGRELAAKDNA